MGGHSSQGEIPVPSISSSARPELDRSPVCREHAYMIRRLFALGPWHGHNTNSKLLIYGLFQEGEFWHRTRSNMSCASRSEATRTHSWSLSNPMYRLLALFAATSVDPLPQNGSTTTCPLVVVSSISVRNSFTGFWATWRPPSRGANPD